jgi:hypothetical protein
MSGVAVQVVSKHIERKRWVHEQVKKDRVSRTLASVDSPDWGDVKAQVKYLPIQEIQRFVKNIPSGTILNLVHKDNPKKPVLITHQGLVVHRGGEILFRHANPGGKMSSEPLEGYLRHLIESDQRRSVLGVNLVQVQE